LGLCHNTHKKKAQQDDLFFHFDLGWSRLWS
jgi:hypothetical protein